MRTAVPLRVLALLLVPAMPLSARAQLAPAIPCEAMVTAGGTPQARWDWVTDVGRLLTETSRVAINERFTLCVFPAPVARDLDVTLRFRPTGGRMDRAGGIAIRVRDANTYYVLRANAAEDNVRLYHVTHSRRVQFAGRDGVRITMGEWHSLRLRAEGGRFAAWLDGAPMFEARDTRIAEAGRVALWSISDSETLFETPRIEVLR